MKIEDRIARDEAEVLRAVSVILERQGGPFAHTRAVAEMVLRDNEVLAKAHD